MSPLANTIYLSVMGLLDLLCAWCCYREKAPRKMLLSLLAGTGCTVVAIMWASKL